MDVIFINWVCLSFISNVINGVWGVGFFNSGVNRWFFMWCIDSVGIF